MSWKSLFSLQRNARRRQQTTVITEALEERVLLAADIEWSFHKTADAAHPNAEEQQLLWLINDARANPTAAGDFLTDTNLTEVASDRTSNGVDLDQLRSEFTGLAAKQPLTFDSRLYAAAKVHADDLIARDTEDNTNQVSRITDAGFDFSAAAGSASAFATSALNAYAGVAIDWDMDETDGMQVGRPDRANQFSTVTEFTNVGFAVVSDTDPSTNVGPLVVAQNFAIANESAADQFNQFITGTVWDDLNNNGMYDVGEGLSGVRVTPDVGDFFAITSAGGGYSIPVTEPGMWNLTFSNGISALKSVSVSTESQLVDVERGALTSNAELASQQFELLTTSAASGGNASFRWELANSGTADAGAFLVEFYLSTDGALDPEDFKVAQQTISSLAAGATTGAMDKNFSLPGPADAFWSGDGDYQLIMQIDSESAVVETDEGNNDVVASNILSVSGTNSNSADLTGGSVSTVASTATAGSSVNYTWVVANTGNSATGEFFVDFYISEDNAFDPNDKQLARQTVASLGANTTTGGRSVGLTLPASGDSFWSGDNGYFIVMEIDPGFSIPETSETNNFVSSATSLTVTNTGSALAELETTSLTISPTTAVAGDEVSVQWQVNNTGGNASGIFSVDFYISQDGANDPMDVIVGSASVSSIGAAGNSGLQTTSFNLPPGLDNFWSGDGAYRILMEVDADANVTETNEDNNFFASTNTVNVTGTDVNNNPLSLDIDNDGTFRAFTDGLLPLRYMAGFQGDSLVESVIGANATRTTGPEIITYLDGATSMLDADGNGSVDTLTDGILILRYFAGFTGEQLTASAVGTGATRTTGAQVIAFLDGFRPTSGPVAGPVGMTPSSLPDLTSTTLSIVPPTAVDAGDTVSVNWNSTNIGDADATAYQVSFFLSNNNTSDPVDLLLTTTTQTSLAVGADTGTLTTSFTLPALNDSYWSGDGNYWVIMLLDDGNSLIEHDETNNVSVVAEPLVVSNTVPAQAELSAGTFRPLTTAADAGSDLDIEWQVNNTGNLNAAGFRVNFFLSTDSGFNPGDKLVDFEESITVGPNGTTGVLTRTITLPNAGDIFWEGDQQYQLLMVVDPTNVVSESNEVNNISTASSGVTVSNTIASKADLTGGSVEPISTNAAAGDTIQVNRNIVNTGVIASGSFEVSYYLSQDGSFGPGDELIGGETITDIAASGTTGTTQVSVTLPTAGEPFWNGDGQYTILAVLDVGADAGPGVEGGVNETDEGNNTIASSNLITVTNTGGGTLDIDDSGSVGTLTDGILALRYLAGFVGSSLTDNAVDPMANRDTDAGIFGYLESFRPNLDIDDNGEESTFTDGLLLLRYFAGFRGAGLVDGVVDVNGGRTSAVEIEAYIAGLLPAV